MALVFECFTAAHEMADGAEMVDVDRTEINDLHKHLHDLLLWDHYANLTQSNKLPAKKV